MLSGGSTAQHHGVELLKDILFAKIPLHERKRTLNKKERTMTETLSRVIAINSYIL